jgi:aspartyl-tRNA(Asn)/glutamyl-tRNA(Gln) amidotransferase subunit C
VSEPTLTPEQVRWVAHLARLDLGDDELALLTAQLGAIVGYVAHLAEVPTDGVEPLAHALPVQNVFRDDETAPSLSVQEALAGAPARKAVKEEQFFAVPAVLE